MHCGRMIWRDRPSRPWRDLTGAVPCEMDGDREHDAAHNRPDTLTPEHIEAWLKED